MEASGQIGQGMGQVAEGAESLSDELAGASEELADYAFEPVNAEKISDPVEINEQTITNVDNYGQSFAPYIIALSLFVGSIAFSTVYPFRSQYKEAKNSFRLWASKFFVILAQGTLQGLLLAVFILKVLEVPVENVSSFLLIVLVISNAWIFLLSFLVAAFDKVGNFLGILLLVLQLGASEGTFPIQLTNGFFQAVHPYSPMTYAIKALRESIFGFEGNVPFGQSVIILAVLWLVMAFLLWAVYYFRFDRKTEDAAAVAD